MGFFKVLQEVELLAGAINHFSHAKGNQNSDFITLDNLAEII